MSTQISQRDPQGSAREPAQDPEGERRSKLAITDHLLNDIEELLLANRTRVPPTLAERLHHVQNALTDRPRMSTPHNLHHAHRLVLALQGPLLAANRRYPQPYQHERHAAGQPVKVRVGSGASWKVLTLPGVPPEGIGLDWLELAEAMVDRAYQRWAWAQHHVKTCNTVRSGLRPALARATAAWENYSDLMEQFTDCRAAADPQIPKR
jgi:hypothetical protein